MEVSDQAWGLMTLNNALKITWEGNIGPSDQIRDHTDRMDEKVSSI